MRHNPDTLIRRTAELEHRLRVQSPGEYMESLFGPDCLQERGLYAELVYAATGGGGLHYLLAHLSEYRRQQLLDYLKR